jgi:hypothetical protein
MMIMMMRVRGLGVYSGRRSSGSSNNNVIIITTGQRKTASFNGNVSS